jgi:hypothetical protein
MTMNHLDFFDSGRKKDPGDICTRLLNRAHGGACEIACREVLPRDLGRVCKKDPDGVTNSAPFLKEYPHRVLREAVIGMERILSE